jgi:hypothetical protein
MALGVLFELRYESPKGVPDWYSPAKVSTKIRNVAKDIITQHKKDINENYYPSRVASNPGEFPKKRTGKLRKSVRMQPTSITAKAFKKITQLVVELGYDEQTLGSYPYWKALRSGKSMRGPRLMLDATAMSVIQVSLAKSNPDPWTPQAEWKPLSWNVRGANK